MVTSFFLFFGVTEVCSLFKLLLTVLFLTNYVLIVLFAYFDESMGSIDGKDHGEAGIE